MPAGGIPLVSNLNDPIYDPLEATKSPAFTHRESSSGSLLGESTSDPRCTQRAVPPEQLGDVWVNRERAVGTDGHPLEKNARISCAPSHHVGDGSPTFLPWLIGTVVV